MTERLRYSQRALATCVFLLAQCYMVQYSCAQLTSGITSAASHEATSFQSATGADFQSEFDIGAWNLDRQSRWGVLYGRSSMSFGLGAVGPGRAADFSEGLRQIRFFKGGSEISLAFNSDVPPTLGGDALSVLESGLMHTAGSFSWNRIADSPISLEIPLGLSAHYLGVATEEDSLGFSGHKLASAALFAGLRIKASVRIPQIEKYLRGVEFSLTRRLAAGLQTDFEVDYEDVRMVRYRDLEFRVTFWEPMQSRIGITLAFGSADLARMPRGAQLAEFADGIFSGGDLRQVLKPKTFGIGLSF